MKKTKSLKLCSLAILVFTLYLSFFPMAHRHGRTLPVSPCAACSLYNETHAKQTPVHYTFAFHRTPLSALVVLEKEVSSHDFLYKVYSRAPPQHLS